MRSCGQVAVTLKPHESKPLKYRSINELPALETEYKNDLDVIFSVEKVSFNSYLNGIMESALSSLFLDSVPISI